MVIKRAAGAGLLTVSAILGVAIIVSSGGSTTVLADDHAVGHILSIQALPESGDMCEFPDGDRASLAASAPRQVARAGASDELQSTSGTHGTAASLGWFFRSDVLSDRQPLRVVADPYLSFAGIAVDTVRDEIVVGDEKMSKIVFYDRRANTPPSAAMTDPKRVIGGDKAFLEYVSSVYVDPPTGDVFAINNDTMPGMPVFGRDAVGNVTPKRRIERPHTSFGITADEEAQELFLTIQDDFAVVVFAKNVADKGGPKRILQGSRTGMADPHGIALDTKRGEIFVANWGMSNERPPLSAGGGGGNIDRPDFPVGRTRVFPATGKIQPASITVYPKGAQGDTPPLRVIQGPKTRLNWATGLAVHPDRGELFVANDVGDEVTVFRVDANGDVAPIRSLKGPKTMIKNPTGVAVDLKNNELWVANYGSHTATAFRIDAAGDVPPVRVIRSAPVETGSPMLSNPHTAVFDTKRKELLVAN
jgi:DNA-binding beta-propeller fold protein YncE